MKASTLQNSKFPSRVMGIMLEEKLRPFHIQLNLVKGQKNFQVVFENFEIFKNFFENTLPLAKIATESEDNPIQLQFSFGILPDELQDETLLVLIQKRLEYIGIKLEISIATGIYSLLFPNAEFLIVLLLYILQKLE